MYDYDDINYEINEVFSYMVKNKKGSVSKMISDLPISKSDILIIVNLFSKNEIILKYKDAKQGTSFSLKNEISPLMFGKAINVGIDIQALEEHFNLKDENDIYTITEYIASGELDRAIEEEDKKKKQEYIKSVEENSKSIVSTMAIGDYCSKISNIINNQEKNKTLDDVSLRILKDISSELNSEFDIACKKLQEKKLAGIKG